MQGLSWRFSFKKGSLNKKSCQAEPVEAGVAELTRLRQAQADRKIL